MFTERNLTPNSFSLTPSQTTFLVFFFISMTIYSFLLFKSMKISLKETKLETRNFKEKFSRGKEIMFLRKGFKKSVKIRKVRLKKGENQPLIIFFFSLSWIRYNTWVYTRVFFYLNNAFVCYFFCVIRQKSKVQTVYEKEWLIVRLLCALLIKKIIITISLS